MEHSSRLLKKEQPIVIDRELAALIGLNEAIVLQQIEYWLEINRKARINFHNDKTWTYNTIAEWNKEFSFWSYDTVKRILKKLETKNLIITGNFNKIGLDRTKWYTINYKKLNELEKIANSAKCTNEQFQRLQQEENKETLKKPNSAKCTLPLGQNALMHKGNLHSAIPENTTEITTEIVNTTQKHSVVNKNKKIIEEKTHLKITANMQKKVLKWDPERLIKAISIFKEKNGGYFSFLEKIYNGDKNFIPAAEIKNNISKFQPKKTSFHNFDETYTKYTPEELEAEIERSQREKYQ